ncbi:hypothetical protein JJJ17_09540 [Paracoccus caeni]|uniref:Uncharacterized protein n=1 Tax=Paracoccus caeni TaxID=657651 RepID=A0A934VUT4_9RHOB|nr:hypothetical protein [Paracoccus caeni]MBK4216166.1 hypothetical protein [Paracoccus caeni]
MMSPDEAMHFLLSNNSSAGTSLNNIMTSQRALKEYPAHSEAYRAHQQILDEEIRKVEALAKESAFENAGVDPIIGMAACDCAPGEPCCFEDGEVADSTDESRKIVWPTASIPFRIEKNLLVIAREMSGSHLTSKVKTRWSGRNCPAGRSETPHLQTRNLRSGPEMISEKSQEVTVGIPTLPSFAVALEQYFPREIILVLIVLDTLLTVANSADGDNRASFTPSQCLSDEAMGATLTVTPIPYLKIDGDATLSTMLRFSTAGVNGSAGASGSLNGVFGNHEISATAEAKSVSGNGLARSNSTKAPGMIGTMASMIGTLNEYVHKGNTSNSTRDVSKYASSITLSKSLALKPKGLEIKEKGGCPDLELKLGELLLELKIGVTGRLDVIDALATYFTGPGAAAIRKARAEMAAGKAFAGKLDAYLEVGAEGTLTHAITSGVTMTIPANLPAPESTSIPEVFRGEIKIRGILVVGIQIEAEVWVFAGKAGASGTVNTSWAWAVRKHGEERQKNYKFEGVVIELKAHAEVGWRRQPSDRSRSAFDSDTLDEPILSSSQEAVLQHLEQSKSEAERIARSGIAGASRGSTYTILQPEDSGWEKY